MIDQSRIRKPKGSGVEGGTGGNWVAPPSVATALSHISPPKKRRGNPINFAIRMYSEFTFTAESISWWCSLSMQ